MSVIFSQNGKPRESRAYAWRQASITVADGTTPNTNLIAIAGWETLFDPLYGKLAHKIIIESTGTLYVKLDNITNNTIIVTATSPYIDDYCQVNRIFVSTNNVGLTITVKLK